MSDSEVTEKLDSKEPNDSGDSNINVGAKKKKNLVLIVGAIFVFVGAGAGGFYFFYLKKEDAHHAQPPKDEVNHSPEDRINELSKLVYVPLPPMVVNLRTAENGRASLLKCVFVLLFKSEDDMKVVEATKPQILDSFQSHIRELNLEQLEGAAGIERLRQALTDKVNGIIAPLKVQKVLVREFLTQ